MESSNEPRATGAPSDAGQDASAPSGNPHGDAPPGPTAHTGTGNGPQPVEPVPPHVRVDRQDIEVSPALLHDGKLTGHQIRELATPPIGADRDLFEIVPGGSDRKIGDDDAVVIRDHLRFFSAPRNINPGGSATPLLSALRPRCYASLRSVRRASR